MTWCFFMWEDFFRNGLFDTVECKESNEPKKIFFQTPLFLWGQHRSLWFRKKNGLNFYRILSFWQKNIFFLSFVSKKQQQLFLKKNKKWNFFSTQLFNIRKFVLFSFCCGRQIQKVSLTLIKSSPQDDFVLLQNRLKMKKSTFAIVAFFLPDSFSSKKTREAFNTRKIVLN